MPLNVYSLQQAGKKSQKMKMVRRKQLEKCSINTLMNLFFITFPDLKRPDVPDSLVKKRTNEQAYANFKLGSGCV